MPRTKPDWAERVTTSADNNKNLNYMEWEELCPHLLRKEHQRAVRIVKADINAAKRDRHNYSTATRHAIVARLERLLAALQKGRA